MASLTIKQIDEGLLRRLREQAKRKNQSMNAFVRDLLGRAVGFHPGMTVHDDLRGLAGVWSDADQREFDEATRPFREIDEGLWR